MDIENLRLQEYLLQEKLLIPRVVMIGRNAEKRIFKAVEGMQASPGSKRVLGYPVITDEEDPEACILLGGRQLP